jgi:hypothetical protein
MSPDQEIGVPFTLASLPHSISCRDGRTHAASVCSISGNKKRKRTEIAVGLDGEGVSIYSVGAHQQLLRPRLTNESCKILNWSHRTPCRRRHASHPLRFLYTTRALLRELRVATRMHSSLRTRQVRNLTSSVSPKKFVRTPLRILSRQPTLRRTLRRGLCL